MNTKELRELLEKATPGPWAVYRCSFADEDPDSACGLNGGSFDACREECHHTVPLKDAALIVALRNAAPLLLDVVEAAEDQCEEHGDTFGMPCRCELCNRVRAYRAAKEADRG
jgi:hypothetical protein